MNTSKVLSRRSAIAMVGVSAIAVSAASSTAIADATNADAELLALGARLEPIIAEWIEFRAIEANQREAWEKACLDADLPRLDPASVSADECRERDLVRSMVHYIGKDEDEAEAEADLDEHGCSIKLESIDDRRFPLCDAILSRRATTARGVGVQARATSFYFPELWGDDDSETVPKRSFIESVSAFSGVVPVPVEEASARSGALIPSRALKAPEPDPIFAAIEAHRKAWDNLGCCSALDEIGTPEAMAELDALWLVEENCRVALTNPTTLPGAAALLRHLAQHESDCGHAPSLPLDRWWHETRLGIADALEKMAVAS